jgi:hypothetical protein
MAAEIINLRHARKQKARADKDKHASENRAQFGRTKAEREREAAEKVRVSKAFDGHKRRDHDPST